MVVVVHRDDNAEEPRDLRHFLFQRIGFTARTTRLTNKDYRRAVWSVATRNTTASVSRRGAGAPKGGAALNTSLALEMQAGRWRSLGRERQ